MRGTITLAILYLLTIVTFANASMRGSGTIPYTIDTANNNISIGPNTLSSITTGTQNIAIGIATATALTTGVNNIIINNGEATLTTGSNNIIMGYNSHTVLATTQYATGFGTQVRPGQNDVAIGNLALSATLTNGLGNTAVGSIALQSVTTGSSNVGVGQGAGLSVTQGANNTLLGTTAGAVITSGNNNTVLGRLVGSTTLTIGSNNILIGTTSAIDATTSSTSNTINIGGIWTATGTDTPATAANTISGTFALTNIASDATHTDAAVCQDTTTHVLYSGSGAAGICLGTSSMRYKKNITPVVEGIAQISKLKPVKYFYREGYGNPNKQLYGFLAEDVIDVMPKLVGLDRYGKPNSVDMVGMIPAIVRAFQQQQLEIEQLKRESGHDHRN